MIGVYSEDKKSLIKISGANSYTELKDAPNIEQNGNNLIINESVVIDNNGNIESNGKLNISQIDADAITFGRNDKDLQTAFDEIHDTLSSIDTDSNNNTFTIQDSHDNTILKVDKDGITSTNTILTDLEIEGGDVTAAITKNYNNIEELNRKTIGIEVEEPNNSFIVNDNGNNVILKVDKEGLLTTEVILTTLDIANGNVSGAIEGIDEKVGNKKVSEQIQDAINILEESVNDELESIQNNVDILDERTKGVSTVGGKSFLIQDEQNNAILKVDKEGLLTTNITLSELDINGHKDIVSSFEYLDEKIGIDTVENQISDAVNELKGSPQEHETLESLENAINQTNSRTAGIDSNINNNIFIIQDENNNAIFQVAEDGTTTSKLYLNELEKDVAAVINENAQNIQNNARNIKSNLDAINILNSDKSTPGSVANQVDVVAEEVKRLVAEAPDTYDTFKEIAQYITTHGGEAAEMAEAINTLEVATHGIDASSNPKKITIEDEAKHIIVQIDEAGITTTNIQLTDLSIENGNVTSAIEFLDSQIGTKSVKDQINEAIDVITGEATDNYTTLGGIQASVEQLKSELQEEIDNDVLAAKQELIGGASDYQTFEAIETEIGEIHEKIGSESVDKQIDDAIKGLINGASEAFNTLYDLQERINDTNERTSGIESIQQQNQFIIQDGENHQTVVVKEDGKTYISVLHLNHLDDDVATAINENINLLTGSADEDGTVAYRIQEAKEELLGGAIQYQTLKSIEDRMDTIVTDDIPNAITELVDGAGNGYQTLGDIQESVNDLIENLRNEILDGSIVGDTESNEDYSIQGIRSDLNAHIASASGKFNILDSHVNNTNIHLTSSQKNTLDTLKEQVFCSKDQYLSYGTAVQNNNKIYFIN